MGPKFSEIHHEPAAQVPRSKLHWFRNHKNLNVDSGLKSAHQHFLVSVAALPVRLNTVRITMIVKAKTAQQY